LLSRLVPKEEKYFGLLSQLAGEVSRGGDVFARIFSDYSSHARYADEIKQIELDCDELAAKITQKLNSTFITPIDREDIYLLVTELDDVIDLINDLARRFEMYNVSEPRPEAREVSVILAQATREIHGAFQILEKSQGIGEHCHTIRMLEKQADTIYRAAIRRLFAQEKDPIEIVKWTAIFERLENSIDRCKDVAEALEAVVVKNK
jgi:predicted phosphate transport protein (TIGR00153 family)